LLTESLENSINIIKGGPTELHTIARNLSTINAYYQNLSTLNVIELSSKDAYYELLN